MTRDERDSYRVVLARHMAELSKLHRAVLFLRLVEEHSPANAAQALDMSVADETRLYREGLAALRALMRKKRPRQ